MIGKTFGYLTVLNFSHKNLAGKLFYKCKCKCGKEIIVYKYHLLNGHTQSCGCYHKERAKEVKTTHGMSRTRLDKIYRAMKERCYNPNHKMYKYYGGKNIKICEEWLNDIENFFNWAKNNGYSDKLTIDRIDSNKDYSPDNCRWITMAEQNKNKSNNIWITYNGETKLLVDWCKLLNLNYFLVHKRLKIHKMTPEEAFKQ